MHQQSWPLASRSRWASPTARKRVDLEQEAAGPTFLAANRSTDKVSPTSVVMDCSGASGVDWDPLGAVCQLELGAALFAPCVNGGLSVAAPQHDPHAKIVLLTTGGTIATVADYSKRYSGAELLAKVPEFGASERIELDEADNRPSPAFEPEEALAFCRRVQQHLNRPEVSGLVITFGTDALDELLYLLYLTVESPKPVVATAAMFHTGTALADGPRNLYHSFIAAGQPELGQAGPVLVFAGMIHSAREVVKVNAARAEAFASPKFGPLGSVEANRVVIRRQHLREPVIATEALEPAVGLVAASLGMDATLVEACLASGSRGIVVSAMGGGALPPRMARRLNELAQEGFPVVLTSRCIEGSVHAAPGRLPGLLTSGDLPAHKARFKLMLALGAARRLPPDEVGPYLAEVFKAGR